MEAIGSYILKSGMLLLIFWSMYRFCLRNETFYHFNRFFLLVGVVVALLLPLVPVHYPVVVTTPEYPLTLEWSTAAPLLTQSVQQSSVIEKILLFMDGLLWVYLLGAGFLLAFRMYGVLHLFAIIRKCGYQTYQNCKLIENQVFKTSFSFFDYIFFPKGEMDDLSKEIMVKHEQAHITQYHWMDLLLVNFLCVFGWFNPIVWFYAKAVRENHEYLADHTVLSSCDRVDYQVTLVNHWLKAPVFPMANSFCYSTQIKRITMMKKNISHPVKKLYALITLPLITLFLGIFAEPVYVAAQEKKVQENLFENQSGKNLYYVVDGVWYDKNLKDIDSKKIMIITPLDAKEAVDKYGPAAKDGAYEIITRKERGAYLEKNGVQLNTKITDESGAVIKDAWVRVILGNRDVEPPVNADKKGNVSMRILLTDMIFAGAPGYLPTWLELNVSEDVKDYDCTIALKKLVPGMEVVNPSLAGISSKEKDRIMSFLYVTLREQIDQKGIVKLDFDIDMKGNFELKELALLKGEKPLDRKVRKVLEEFPEITPPVIQKVPVKLAFRDMEISF